MFKKYLKDESGVLPVGLALVIFMGIFGATASGLIKDKPYADGSYSYSIDKDVVANRDIGFKNFND